MVSRVEDAAPVADRAFHRPATGPTSPSKSAVARRLCSELLSHAVGVLQAESARLFAVPELDRLVLVASTGADSVRGQGVHDGDGALDAGAVRAALKTRSAVATAVPAAQPALELLAIPCLVDGAVPSVLVAQRLTERRGSLPGELEEPESLALGLAVERYLVQLTLEESLAEAEAVRRQLDAYAVDLRSTYMAERDRSDELASALAELTRTYESTVRGLAIAVEAKDEYTGGHLQRVSRYGMAITAVLAPEHACDPQFEYGFLLHDVGKLAVPDAVLTKDGPLDPEEWVMMRSHPEAGRAILEKIPFLSVANEIVHAHHERWDGKGYPRGLRGDEIHLGARIFPLADAFDALTTTRPYRGAFSIDEARRELRGGSGTQFWPDAVAAFMSIPTEELELVRAVTSPNGRF